MNAYLLNRAGCNSRPIIVALFRDDAVTNELDNQESNQGDMVERTPIDIQHRSDSAGEKTNQIKRIERLEFLYVGQYTF